MKKHWDLTQIAICKKLDGLFHFKGQSVLDIGCGHSASMVKYIANGYSPKMIYGIDPAAMYDNGENWEVRRGDSRNLEFEDNSFDIVYSNSTFEHIDGIVETLSEMKRVLKPYGRAYISFAPAWTSVCGHHAYNWRDNFTDECIAKGDDIDENIIYSVPAWGHLYMSEDEMREHLHAVGFQENKIENLLNCIYHNDFINRIPASQIKENIIKSGMIIRSFYEGVTFSRKWALDKKGTSELTLEAVNRIEKAGYSISEIGIVHMTVIMEKYESIL